MERATVFKGRALLLFVGGLFIGVTLPKLGLLSAVSPGDDCLADVVGFALAALQT